MDYLIILVVLILANQLHAFDINMTSINYLMADEARILIGKPTSTYPKEAFINSILYGHSDVNFTYKDFISSYGTKVDQQDLGYLVIGKDAKLGGIVLSPIDSVALPIPGGKITKVPFPQLSKYFPNGYIILSSKSIEYGYGFGRENSTYGEAQVCNYCYAGFMFSDGWEVSPFQINAFWEKWIIANVVHLDFKTFGYLKEFDFNSYQGLIKIYLYHAYGEDIENYYVANDKYPNFIYLSSSDHKNFTYNGSLMAEIPNYSYYYNFTGWWYDNS